MIPKAMTKFLDSMEKPLNMFLGKSMMGSMLKIFLILYSSVVAPKLSDNVLETFKNPFVKFLGLTLIVYSGTKDLQTSMLLTIAFIATMVGVAKLDTISSLKDMLDLPVDSVQKVSNELLDGAQELSTDVVGVIPEPVSSFVTPVTKMANSVIDSIQDVANMVVDGTQDTVGKLLGQGKKMAPVDKKAEKKMMAPMMSGYKQKQF